MAQPMTCDICQGEDAVQILTNLADGTTMTLGTACLAVFYHHSLVIALDAGEHTKIPAKCQCCRRIHEAIAVLMNPPADPAAPDPELPGIPAAPDLHPVDP